MEYQPTIGLEIHIELKTKSKMFCSCKNDPLETRPNVNICPVCTGQPGSLPVINKEAVKKVIKTGFALNSQILKKSRFDRKNYFYPDLPKGYQISQYALPLCKGGSLVVGDKEIRITRIHLEEDTARLIHHNDYDYDNDNDNDNDDDDDYDYDYDYDNDNDNDNGNGRSYTRRSLSYSLVDFNRAGVPLMELVTEPDITSAREAKQFAQELKLTLNYLGVSEADMEKGQMRVEANISLLSPNSPELGTKVEIKNLNSFKAVEKAIEYEIKRQTKILEAGKKIVQETRGWDDIKGLTRSQRVKETSEDYRYFPEPDLPPLEIDKKEVEKIKAQIPELPWQKRLRFQEEYFLSPQESAIFIQKRQLGEYFEKVLSELRNWVKVAEQKREVLGKDFEKLVNLTRNYLAVDLLGLLGEESVIDDRNFPITPENFAEFIKLLYYGEISSKIGKQILKEMVKTGADPSHIIQEKNLSMIRDKKMVEEIVNKVIKENPKPVEDFRQGKKEAVQFLIGQVMRETRGRAEPGVVKQVLTKKLEEVK